MDTLKPAAIKIMQEFQDFDNKGVNVSKRVFNVVQNSKLCFMTCRKVFLFGLKFTDSPRAVEWASRSVQNCIKIPLPETFEKLQKVPLDKPYNISMSLDKD